MFRFLNKIFKILGKRKDALQDPKSSPTRNLKLGQVAVIIILVSALGLIFLAIVMNFGRISQVKTLTMIAANSSASQMASFFASYGEQLYQQTLGGHRKICALTGVLITIITVVIVVIIVIVFIIFVITTAGAGLTTTQLWVIAIIAVVGVAAAVTALSLQLAVVQPGITSMWNKMMAASLSITDQFVEQGIQSGLRASVTDRVEIPDFYDIDTDGLYDDRLPLTVRSEADFNLAEDTVSRFGFYNNERIRRVRPSDIVPVQQFRNALEDFLYPFIGDTFGLYDPLRCQNFVPGGHSCCPLDRVTNPNFPALCDVCCQQQFLTDRSGAILTDTDGNPIRIRPECCEAGSPARCGNPDTCDDRSSYDTPYPSIYDKFYEDASNNPRGSRVCPFLNPLTGLPDPLRCLSFREKLGRDDEHYQYQVNILNPNWHVDIPAGVQLARGPVPVQADPLDQKFFLDDTTGYYSAPVFPDDGNPLTHDQDEKLGIFPFFYKIADWGSQLTSLTYTNEECHWCDPAGDGGVVPTCPSPNPLPREIQTRLTLPDIPGIPGVSQFNGGFCVDNTNLPILVLPPLFANPQLADLVPLPNIFAPDNRCASSVDPAGGWKRGADRFCTSPIRAPYPIACPKHGTTCTEPDPDSATGFIPEDCQCGRGNALPADPYWPEDNLDDIIYGLTEFIEWAEAIVRTPLESLTQNFAEWYEEAAEWIEPSCVADPPGCPDPAPEPDACNCDGSFTELVREGALHIWRREMEGFRDPILNWIIDQALLAGGGGNQYVGDECNIDDIAATGVDNDSVWCVPPARAGGNEYGINECNGVNHEEAATFDSQPPAVFGGPAGNGVRGDLEDVMACLRWNVQDTTRGLAPFGQPNAGYPTVVTGNAEKFQLCADYCNDINCTNYGCLNDPNCFGGLWSPSGLPRSLVPGVPDYQPSAGDDTLYQHCIMSETIPRCNIRCNDALLPVPDLPLPPLPLWVAPPDIAQIDNLYNVILPDCLANPGNTWPNQCAGAATTIVCNSPTLLADLHACACTFNTGSCSGWCPGGDTTYLDAVVAASLIEPSTSPDCDPLNPRSLVFRTAMLASANEARNQVAKFEKRLEFLQNRYQEAMNIVGPTGILTEGINEFTAFLDNGTDFNNPAATPVFIPGQDSPSEALIQARKDLTNAEPSIPSVAVYAWRDLPLKTPRTDPFSGTQTTFGYWHIVKAEVRIPRRCNNACGLGGTADPGWPRVKTFTKSWGTKRCYELDNTEGMVKARVIRWDEDKDPRLLTWPNGTPIWSIRLFHPDVGRRRPEDFTAICEPAIDNTIEGSTTDPNDRPWGHAFMLNKIPDLTLVGNWYTDCWKAVHEVLKSGVVSDTCAEYYFGLGDATLGRRGFRLKFVPCDARFLDGDI